MTVGPVRYVALAEVIHLHRQVIEGWGGASGLRDLGALEAAVAQPRQTFDGAELYPSLAEKATAIGFALIRNHPFVDGNKRVGHAALEVFLVLNDYELDAEVDDAERMILGVAASIIDRPDFLAWVRAHMRAVGSAG